jgi:hypothetical protein
MPFKAGAPRLAPAFALAALVFVSACSVPIGRFGEPQAPVSGGPDQTSCLEACERDFRICADQSASTRQQPSVRGAAAACAERASECRRRCGS